MLLKYKSYLATKEITNFIWLFADKVFRLGGGILIFFIVARYLGPTNFGLLGYSQAILSVFSALSSLGLYSVIVRDLVKGDNENKVLGTAFALRILGGVLSYIVIIGAISLIRPEDNLVRYVIAFIGLSLIFNASDVIKAWYESEVRSKTVVIVESFVFMISSALKIYFVYLELSIIAFAIVISIESFLSSAFLSFIYIKNKSIKKWVFDKAYSIKLMHQSWPLIISSFAWIVYTRVDTIMVGEMLGVYEVGLYSAATKLGDIVILLPTILLATLNPSVLRIKKHNHELYEKKFQQIYYLIISFMMTVTIIVCFFSSTIIQILFGAEFLGAANVLKIYFLVALFNSLALISGKYLLNNGLQKITMKRHVLGIFINIPLNYFLIPRYGVEGAAIASLITLFLTCYFFDLIFKETRLIFYHKTKSLLLFWLYEAVKKQKN